MFLVLETIDNTLANYEFRKHCFRNKNVSEFLGKHFCFLGSKFCFRNNVSRVGKQGNIDRKHNVSATMFPSLRRALTAYTLVIKTKTEGSLDFTRITEATKGVGQA